MTLEYPLWMQENSYAARLDRQLISAIFSEGVLSGFVVSERGAGANMSVDVAAGVALVDGDDQSNQGTYLVQSTATENVAVSAAPGSNSRYDIVVLQVNDSNAGGSPGDNFEIQVITGTASSSPVVPSVPGSAILLATIGPIASSTTAITDDLITDARSMATLAYDVVDDAQATRLGTPSVVNGAVVRRSATTGSAAFPEPTSSDHPATKNYVDNTAGSVSATANSLVRRSAGGRISSVDPAVDENVATKGYVDGTAGTSAATASALMRRDSNGRAKVADPSAGTDIANKQYVDTNDNPPWLNIPGTSIYYRKVSGIVQVHGVVSTTPHNLPAGYRPDNTHWCVGWQAGEQRTIRIETNGDVSALTGSARFWTWFVPA